jgi:hypothetical protein
MRKSFTMLLTILSFHSFAQNKNWEISFSSQINFGGPAASLRTQMRQQGFNDKYQGVVFFGANRDYPKKMASPNLMIRISRKTNNPLGWFAAIGLADKARIKGYKFRGYTTVLFFEIADGQSPIFDYSLYQLHAGAILRDKKSKVQFGLAPTVYLFEYDFAGSGARNKILPGATANMQIPLNGRSKVFCMHLLMEGSFGAPAKFGNIRDANGFKPGPISMSRFSFGLMAGFRS